MYDRGPSPLSLKKRHTGAGRYLLRLNTRTNLKKTLPPHASTVIPDPDRESRKPPLGGTSRHRHPVEKRDLPHKTHLTAPPLGGHTDKGRDLILSRTPQKKERHNTSLFLKKPLTKKYQTYFNEAVGSSWRYFLTL